MTPAELVTAIVTEAGVFEPGEPAAMTDADALFASARRPLVIGIGGGGDVVGALATAEACRLYHGAEPVVGGVTWERRVVDPLPGPRSPAEIEGGRELAPGVLAAGPDTRVRENGVHFAEARMAGFLGEETVLVDVTRAPREIAAGLEAAAARARLRPAGVRRRRRGRPRPRRRARAGQPALRRADARRRHADRPAAACSAGSSAPAATAS